ncbi:hypothetical protein AK88_01720 [Plasmodium fragile]|uniref:Uncharacterized protein n=1 Tax=Plasmodium fragile TaxID=5857 RepID=A0A0D9QNJ0_PLAFR|nr:uncharacterized protein AK88_01720 [Plasmodium fragile]KJP88640.1 hypothetical protein AK88_01720 [Plasmodium fragile]
MKMPKGTFPLRREKRCNDVDAQSCRTRKRASYIHRCLNVRKLQKCGELRKMENYCLYVNLKELLQRSYCKGKDSNTNGSCLKVPAPPRGEMDEERERRSPYQRCCNCASHTFDKCYITGLHIFEGIFLTACSDGIVGIFDKNLNNILSRRVATSPINNISVSKKENALCFADSSNHLYVVHLNRRNMCKGYHFNISKRDSHLDESAACASTPYQGGDEILNSVEEDEKHIFLNHKDYAHLTKKEKNIVQAFLYNNISSYHVKNLNCCVINPYFHHHQSNSICVLTANKIVSLLNIFEFHINNSVLFRGQNILSLHWHSLYVFICTGASIFVVNFFDKTKIAHVVLANLDMIEKVEVGQAGRLGGEKNVKQDMPVNHNSADMNTCSDQVDGVTNEPQMMCALESIHICELEKGEYTIARGKNVKIVKIEKKNGIEKISISNEFDVHNTIISISPYYNHHLNGFPDNEVFLSVITALDVELCDGENYRTCTHLEHIIVTRGNYLMYRNCLHIGGAEKDTIRKEYLANTPCTPYPGGSANGEESNTNKMLPIDETTCDRAENSHFISNPDGGVSQITNLFQYMKLTPTWGQGKRSGAIERCLYIYGENTLLQFRSKTVAEFFFEVIKKNAKNGRNILLLLDVLKRQPICKKQLTQIGLSLINAFIEQTNYFIAANVFILLCNHFCDKYRVIYNVMEIFFLRRHLHILSLFYRKLKEERTDRKKGIGHSSLHVVRDKKRRFITRKGSTGEEKKIKSALYMPHLCYFKNGRKKKKKKRDKKERLLNYEEWKKKKRKKRKQNFLFFATKKLFNQFLVFLLHTDAYEFRKVYKISSKDDLNAGMLVKHIVHFLEGDLSVLKKKFIRCSGVGGSDGSSGSCGRGRNHCANHHTDRSRRSAHGVTLKEKKKNNAEKGILLDILLDIFFKFDIPLDAASFALLCKDREKEQQKKKKKKNEPHWNSNNGEVITNNDKRATTQEEDKFVKKNLPDACLQESNRGCTNREKNFCSYRYKEKSACARGEEQLANEESLHRNEHRSEGGLIPSCDKLAPLPHQRDGKHEGDQRDDEKENTYLRMEIRRYHAGWDSDRNGGINGVISGGINRDTNGDVKCGSNRGGSSNGTDEEAPRGGDAPQSARQPRQKEKRMKRRSRGVEGQNRPRHNSNGTNTTNTLTLGNLTNDYFSCVTHRRSTPLTFEDLAQDSSPQNLRHFEQEFDNVKKMEIIKMLIRKKNKNVFAYLKQCTWQILKKITQRFVLKLFRLSRVKTAKLLVIVKVKEKNKYRYFFNPKDVIRRLKERPFFVYTYLKHVKNVKYLSRYIDLFLFLMFVFEPLLLVSFLYKHYRCVSFKRVLFFICFFDRLHVGEEVTPLDGDVTNENVTAVQEELTNEEVSPVEEAVTHENVTQVQEEIAHDNVTPVHEEVTHENITQVQEEITNENGTPLAEAVTHENVTPAQEEITHEKVTPVDGDVTKENVTPVQEQVSNENVSPVDGEVANENVAPDEETPPRLRPPRSKSSLFQNERVTLLYRYLLDEQVEKEKLEELFNYIKQPSKKRPRGGANFFLSVKAFMYEKFGYINKALTIYKQLSNYNEMIYLVKVHNLLIDDAVMKKAEDNLASLNGVSFLSGVDRRFLHGRHVGIASAGGEQRRFRLRSGRKKTNKGEEDAHSVFTSNGGDDRDDGDAVGVGHPPQTAPMQTETNSHCPIGAIDQVDQIGKYVHSNAHFATLDREIMLSLYTEVEGKGRRKGHTTCRKGKRKSNRMKEHHCCSGGISPPSTTRKEIILKKYLMDNSSREMHYVTLMCILQELFYVNELSENYNKILMRCKENIYNSFNEIKKKGYVIYNGVIKKEMKNNNLYLLDINDYYFINDKVQDKRSNECDMIMPYMDEQHGLLERSGGTTDKEEQELPLHIQKEVPSNYFFYEQIHEKSYVSILSSFCSFCHHNIYRDLCAFDGRRRYRRDTVVFFFCNHLYHLKCLRERRFACLACHD